MFTDGGRILPFTRALADDDDDWDDEELADVNAAAPLAAGVGAPVKHVHHGRTPAAWAGSLIALFAFIVGGIGFVIPPHPNWIVVIIGAVLLVASLVVTLVMRKLGLGAD